MILDGKQYARLFFKKEEDQGQCKCCHFSDGRMGCSRPVEVVSLVGLGACIGGMSGKGERFWSWVQIGEVANAVA